MDYTTQPHLPFRGPLGVAPGLPPTPKDERKRFHQFNSIVAPVAGSLLQTITVYTCPTGHEAKVVGLFCGYVGSGFVEGDATLLYFSIRLNGASYIQDYAQIPYTLGSLTSGPWPVPAGIQLAPGDTLEFLVSVPGGSAIATGAPNRCHGHFVGTYRPVGV